MWARTLVLVSISASSVLAQSCEPVLLASLKAPSQDTAATGDIGVISMFESGLKLVDITNPASPETITDFIQLQRAPVCIAVSGSFVYLAEYNRFFLPPYLEIVDISDPFEPVSVAEIELEKIPFGIDVQGDLLFLPVAGQVFDDEMRIFDIHDPSSPFLLSSIKLSRRPRDSDMADGLLYFVSSSTFFIYDVTQPSTPDLVGQTTAGLGALNVDYTDGFVYIASGIFGFQIVDVRDPTNPQLITTLDLPGDATDVTVKNGTAYASYSVSPHGPFGVAAIDITDPFNPTIRGTVDLPTFTHSIALADNNTLLVSTLSGVTHFVDITPCDTCPADLTGSSDPDEATYGVPDGDADSDDFFFYLDAFANADLTICDIDGDADCDAKDFFAYLDLFAAGC